MFYRFLPVILLTALTLLGGCTQYREVPPQTVEGRACVRQCSEQASECRQRACLLYTSDAADE